MNFKQAIEEMKKGKKVIEEIGEETLKKYYFNDIDSVIESECEIGR